MKRWNSKNLNIFFPNDFKAGPRHRRKYLGAARDDHERWKNNTCRAFMVIEQGQEGLRNAVGPTEWKVMAGVKTLLLRLQRLSNSSFGCVGAFWSHDGGKGFARNKFREDGKQAWITRLGSHQGFVTIKNKGKWNAWQWRLSMRRRTRPISGIHFKYWKKWRIRCYMATKIQIWQKRETNWPTKKWRWIWNTAKFCVRWLRWERKGKTWYGFPSLFWNKCTGGTFVTSVQSDKT